MALPAAAIPLIAAGVGAAGDVLGGIIGDRGQQAANAQNIQLAREQMAFQERMSSTANQRAARDMELAGLNRILALGKPASSPAGQTATVVNPRQMTARGVSQAAHSAMALNRSATEIKNIQAQTRQTEQNTALLGIRTIIAKHGEEVASVAADIARTVRALIGDKSPEEISNIIKREISKAQGALTNALESGATTAKDAQEAISNARDDIITYVLDAIDAVTATPGKITDWYEGSGRKQRNQK